MQITLNGKPYRCDSVQTVAELLVELDVTGRRVAVMVNDIIVKKDGYERNAVEDGDRVEVIQMVGGG